MKSPLNLKQYFLQFVAIYKLYIMLSMVIAALVGVFEVSVDYKIKEVIDSISLSGGKEIGYFLALFVIYKLLYHGVFFVQRLLDIRYKPKILEYVVKDIYSKTVEHSLHWFDSHLSGEISSKISDFQDAIVTIINCLFRIMRTVITIIITLFFCMSCKRAYWICFMYIYHNICACGIYVAQKND